MENPQSVLARKAKNKADEDYKQIVGDIGPILEFVANTGFTFADELSAFQDTLMDVYSRNEPSLLLENMQVIRIDRNIDRNYYRYHTVNVALLNAMIGQMLKMGGEEFDRLVKLGLVMDLGMIRLPEEIKQRDRKLTAEEFATLRTHPQLTVEVLKKSQERDALLIEAVASHHERFDGSGYPKGAKGSAVPEIARISAVSDTFDAAMAKKKYGTQKSPFDILAEILENSGMRLDPSITRVAVTGFTNMLVGRHVVLSDRSVAKVLEVDLNNLSYPVVKILNQRIQTDANLHPVEMSGYFPMF